MKPEQREELRAAAEKIIDDGWYEERDKGMAIDACASDYDFIFKANPSAILSLIAQVEALTVPEVYLVYAFFPYGGDLPARIFAQKDDAIAFAAKCNDYEAIRPARRSVAESEWKHAHPAPIGIGCHRFDVEAMPFVPVTIPANPVAKEEA